MFKRAGKQYSSVFPARLENLKGILEFVEGLGRHTPLSARDITALKLSVEEVCTNIIRHSYLYDSGEIKILGIQAKHALTLRISDEGRPFDPTKLRETQLDQHIRSQRKGGLGLQLVKKLMDEVEYRYQNGENCLKLVKRYPGAKSETRPARKMNLRLKVRWAAWMVILIGAAGFFFVASNRIENRVRNRMVEDTQILTETVARNSTSALEIGDDLALSKLVGDFASGKKDLAYLVITDSSQMIWASARDPLQVLSRWQNPAGLKVRSTEPHEYSDDLKGRIYHFVSPVRTGTKTVGYVYLGLGAQSIAREIGQESKMLTMASLLLLALGWIGVYLVSRVAFKPVDQLRARIEKIGQSSDLKQLDTDYNEIEEILKAFGQATDRIKQSQQATSAEERLKQELAQAEQIRQALIPKAIPRVKGVQIASLYKIAREIGGDYFDFVQIDGDNLGIAVADIAGKGISAALVMASVRTALRLQAQNELDPARVLDRVDAFITAEIPKGMFVTMFYAVVNLAASQLACASAGHNPALLYQSKAKKIVRINPRGMPLGLKLSGKDVGRESVRLQLAVQDILVLYTDGITECRNPAGEQFGLGRLSELIHTHSFQGAEELKNLLEQKLREFSGSADSVDDVTLVIFKLAAQEGQTELSRIVLKVENGELQAGEACRLLGIDYRHYRRYRFREKWRKRPPKTQTEFSNEIDREAVSLIVQQPEIGLAELKKLLQKSGTDPDPQMSSARLLRRLVAIGLDTLKSRYEYILRDIAQLSPEGQERFEKLRQEEKIMAQLYQAESRSGINHGQTRAAGIDFPALTRKKREA